MHSGLQSLDDRLRGRHVVQCVLMVVLNANDSAHGLYVWIFGLFAKKSPLHKGHPWCLPGHVSRACCPLVSAGAVKSVNLLSLVILPSKASGKNIVATICQIPVALPMYCFYCGLGARSRGKLNSPAREEMKLSVVWGTRDREKSMVRVGHESCKLSGLGMRCSVVL